MACSGLKRGSFHLFVHPKRSRVIFEKTHFLPMFDPFLVPKRPIFKAFWDFRRVQTGLPRSQNGPKTFVFAFHVIHDHF